MNSAPNITFEVVITTYNRKKNVSALVNSILQLEIKPKRIIVVDSSDDLNEELVNLSGVNYIISNKDHQNQPYKRLVGAYASDAENIIFFDDDIEILDERIFEKLLPLFEDSNVVAFTSNIDFQNFEERNKLSGIADFFLFLTGKPLMKSGELGLAGYYGATNKEAISKVKVLKGPLMGFKRDIFIQLPTNDFLDLFDLQRAIPEDKILAIRTWRHGDIINYPENLVRHPKIESTYFKNLRNHTMRVLFSRYIINMELSVYRSSRYSVLYKIHFWYYISWRLIIATSKIIGFKKANREKLWGVIDAIKCVFQFNNGSYLQNFDFHCLAKSDAKKARIS
jgi:glycosyltransferase involved in cell wall biosynthesis